MKTNPNSTFKKVLYIILIVALIFLFYQMFNTGNNGERIDLSQFEEMLKEEEQQISDIYASGGTAYVRKNNSEIELKDFPKNSDYFFTYSNQSTLDNIIRENNSNDTRFIVNYNTEVKQDSFMNQLLPYLSIGIVLLIGFMIFKMLSANNKGALSFGKSRVRMGENVKVKFSDVAGAEEEKAELQEVVEFLKNPQKFTELGARIPKGVLLVGPPGTGKTLLAKAVAGESNVPFFLISGSDFVEMFVGVGAARVRDLFDNAKRNTPCIVFIDEIDAVGRQRGAGLGGGNDEREQTLNQLLVEMDGFSSNEGIIVLAATNRSDVLDPALTRPGRFDRQIYVNIPDVKGRESILRIHARNKPLADEVNFKTLARITSGFTGADIENMLNEAAILAARANRSQIIMADLTEGVNKVIMGPQKKSSLVTEKDKILTSYHESGHAILAKLLKYCDEVQEVSIIPRGNAAGYTMSRPETDDKHLTFNKLNDTIAMTMGGRIAEEIVFGDISTGASSDIAHATEIARKMVTEWGMSKKLGFVSLGSSNELFLGRDYQVHNKYSEKIAAEIDEEIKEIINNNYSRAKKLLVENKNLLDEMSLLLLDKNTIYQEEVEMLMNGKSAIEIAKIMTEKEEEERIKQEKAKKAREEELKARELNMKLKTAEVLEKSGIITKDELQKIKDQQEKPKTEDINKIEPENKINSMNNIDTVSEKLDSKEKSKKTIKKPKKKDEENK